MDRLLKKLNCNYDQLKGFAEYGRMQGGQRVDYYWEERIIDAQNAIKNNSH